MVRLCAAGHTPTSVLFDAERSPGAFGRARSPNSLRMAERARPAEPDPDEGQEEAQGRDADPREDHQVGRRENRFHLSDVSDDLVDVEVPGEAHSGGPEA